MSIGILSVVVVVSLFLLLATGLPVAFTLVGLGLFFTYLLRGPSSFYGIFANGFSTGITDIYLALPTFVFMAEVLEFSGIASALYDMMYKWMGGLRGGLAAGTVAICTIIAAMTGIGATGVVTMGIIALPEMLRRGYSKSMASGCIVFGGALGPLIPPSVLMIIVGGIAGVSIGKLFMGGVVPGLLASFLAISYILTVSYLKPSVAPAPEVWQRATWPQKMASLYVVIPSLALVVVVLGAIYAGIATPTEAGGVGALGAVICAAIYRKLNWTNIKNALNSTLKTSVMVLWLLFGGRMFTTLLGTTEIGQTISTAFTGLGIPPMGVLIIIMIIGFLLGMIIDGGSISIICLPLFVPVMTALQVDLLWFCLLWTINMISGYLTPPFAMNCFYLKAIAPPEVTMKDIYNGVWPYVGIFVVVIVLGVVFPQTLLWLPNRMIK